MYGQQMQQYGMSNNGITWVQGIEGAKAYQLYPSSNVLLMDSDSNDTFYIKTSDNIGMCSLRKFRYTEVTDELKHTDYLHTIASQEIDELRKVYTPPTEMEDAWNKSHTRYVEKVAWIRQMLAM